MLVVEAEGLKIRFSFRHTKAEYREPHSTDEVEYADEAGKVYIPAQTECILEVTDVLTERVENFFGYAICHQMDQFNKETGRKISLQRALSEAFPGINDVKLIGTRETEHNRAIRRIVWLRYFMRHLRNADFAAVLPTFI